MSNCVLLLIIIASKASEVSCWEYKCHQIMDFLDVLLDYNFWKDYFLSTEYELYASDLSG